jgi:uncharacterized protein (UPF0276 family)
MTSDSKPLAAGIGLRLPHIVEVVATRPAVGWLEIHPENFMVNPHAMELLVELSESYPISIHTVGISVGSAEGVDRTHLKRLRALVDRIKPCWISGHLAWSTYRNEYLNDLLPIPYTSETLRLIVSHIREVEDSLGQHYLVENPSSYVGFRDSTMTEADFLSELVIRSGCLLLCDVSNVVVSAHNMGYDPHEYIRRLPADAIGELHLGGYTPEPDTAFPDSSLLIDTHAAAIAEDSWDLYRFALQRFGAKPTLIEWDNNIPDLATLIGEAIKVDEIVRTTMSREPYCGNAH